MSTEQSSGSARLEFLDVLRGIAALLVVVYHAGQVISPTFRRANESVLQLGHLGVVLFFLVSGYVIQQSLERQEFGRFWTRRICRLYPLYWVTCGFAVLATSLPPRAVFTNLTMTQELWGVPHLLPIFWTLSLELVFYVLMSALFALGLWAYLLPLTYGLLGSALLSFPSPVSHQLAYLGVLCTGAVVVRLQDGRIAPRAVFPLSVLLPAALVLSAFAIPDGDPMAPLSLIIPRLLALAVFALALRRRSHSAPRPLVLVGCWSYGLYMGHLIVIALIPQTPWPGLTVLVWLAAAVAVAAAAYRYVERPGIALGRRLTAMPVAPVTWQATRASVD